jgi:hypothetical protein
MLSVKGSLFRHRNWWNSNIDNNFIKGVINNGYALPLIKLPVAEHLDNNKSARENASFVDSEIVKLLADGIVVQLNYVPDIINALTVAINHKGKQRLVLNLRQINK